MPKKSAKDEAAPRRRGAKAAVIDVETERNLVMRVLLHSPKDTLAGLVAAAAIGAIVANALFLQTGRHPAPMFGTVINLPAPSSVSLSNPLPRPRPVGADTSPLEPRATEFRTEPKPVERVAEKTPEKPVEATASTRPNDPMTNLVKATTSTSPSVVRPPAPIPVQSPAVRRIAGVQRALSEYGYGNLKITGTMSGETQSAIQKFEREHKMQVTGQVSDRLLRELAAAIGHPVE
ncbi:peptidoglycan-binding protein [Bradyrhizobium sp. 180]|uniref:peptidoglycan-binding domain-containing protein n=1 Tax=unclassified Bradyrhizobium TaxID=2631580 RepID=UPI001FFB8126|nr:peptidoglycan-binding protein [Bradyrhizobium sp. CW12]MCK1488954.1 peptidoglycan-binding protein [Bradyrhizobium sp. 180]MCK1528084.1 peptidoglycan-binding protein [Bradyrhizobium sp. 182]MCK1597717.1 peptidoglycan-binding protein [Bradyrhizobium sp. 164]MCK1619218.1 peptidoglycan-binding protein [Bradyrhizobium sp. 159]MCK1643231.1 peptidoglycan-binding protein [Bradyrhizobium sp. 154]MCK1669377.1 peptidoglycan-binding protein [Bradyrhizobium sp. 153]MCK1757904.1 peptidoglycan-binding p